MYAGELLPGNLSVARFFQKSNYYKELYIETVQKLEERFQEEKNYKERLQLYARAAAIYPFDEWQVKQIRCNLEMYRYKEAREIYDATMELYAREMGSMPTERMQECFEEIELMDEQHQNGAETGRGWSNLDMAFLGRKGDIQTAILEKSDEKGAYYCTYPSFVDYCRLVVRSKKRNEYPAVLMFLTLSRWKHRGNRGQDDQQAQMDILKEAIGGSLRSGDAYTRYGSRHFIVMLLRAKTDHCSDIFRRIEKMYIEKSGKGRLWYYSDMVQELQKEDIQEKS